MFVPVDDIQDARKRKKGRQAFYTPLALVRLMVETATHWPSCRVLEPSAGDGRFVWELMQHGLQVDACELDDSMRERCRDLGANIVGTDFLKYQPTEPYDLIVMNPPFTKGQDRKHIEHAYSMLRRDCGGGELVAISSTSFAETLWTCKANLPGCVYAVYERLGKELFKEAGTGVETLLVTIKSGVSGECEGFINGATNNAALTITSDQKLLTEGKRLSMDQLRDRMSKQIAEMGGSCYGVDWDQVFEYVLKIHEPFFEDWDDPPADVPTEFEAA